MKNGLIYLRQWSLVSLTLFSAILSLAQQNIMVYTEFDSLKSGKVFFGDNTYLTTAPINFWTNTGSGISYQGPVEIDDTTSMVHTTPILALNRTSHQFKFVSKREPSGFSDLPRGALVFSAPSGFSSTDAVIQQTFQGTGVGNAIGLLFYPGVSGYDPNDNTTATPMVAMMQNGVGINTLNVPTGRQLFVEGSTETDSLFAGKITFEDGTSQTSAPVNFWTNTGSGISYRAPVAIDDTTSQVYATPILELDRTSHKFKFVSKRELSGSTDTPLSALVLSKPSGFSSIDAVIQQTAQGTGVGNSKGLIFYPSVSGYDPDDNTTATPMVSMMQNGVGINTLDVPADRELFVEGATETDSLYSSKLAIDTTYIPAGYKVAVNGNVIAEQVDVALSQNWPDYVFEEGYGLISLSDTEAFINENHHLPGIASAEEMEEKGVIDLAGMNIKLLEKIEELTLHLIEQNKQLQEVKEMNRELHERIEDLESHD